MSHEHTKEPISTPQIAIVGTTRAGKSVFTTVLAKHLERKQDGVRLSPKGGKPKTTYAQIDEWWNTLQTGNWLPATLPGSLIELEWDLCVQDKKIPLRMFDYAGETLSDLFNGKKENSVGAAKEFFEKVSTAFESASILLVLINIESFIEKDISIASENKGTLLNAMTSFLGKIKRGELPCRVCFVFTAYDQYKPLILSKWGSVKSFLEQEIPPLYYEFMDEKSDVKILPVAAVSETEPRVDPNDGRTVRYPKPGFRAAGFDPLVNWLVEAVGRSKIDMDRIAADAIQDDQNIKFVAWCQESWEEVCNVWELAPIDRFLEKASKGLPFPHRSNAPELDAIRLSFVNAATDLKARISAQIFNQRWESYTGLLKLVLSIVAAIVLIPSIIGYYRSANQKRVDLQIATELAEANRPKLPRPASNGNPTWVYTCDKGTFDCWEHRATVTVPVKNEGDAGNITVTFKLGNRTNSTTKFFNANESSTVSVTINQLPNHASNDASYDIKPSQ